MNTLEELLEGHAIEGKPPSFTRDPRFMAVSAPWYARAARPRAQRHALSESVK